MTQDEENAKVAALAASVAAITSASDSAEALIRGISERISAATADVDTSDSQSVDSALDQLDALTEQLNNEASQLSAAVLAGTPADPSGSGSSDVAGAGTSSGEVPPDSREAATLAGGYNDPSAGTAATSEPDNTPPPAAGQHEEAPVEQPENSTLGEAEGTAEEAPAEGESGDGTSNT